VTVDTEGRGALARDGSLDPAGSGIGRSDRAADRTARPVREFGFVYHRLLLFSDALALLMALAVSLLVARITGSDAHSMRWAAIAVVALPAWVLIAYQFGLYGRSERRFELDYVDELTPAMTALIVWCWFLALLGGLTVSDGPNLFGAAILWFASIPLLIIFRALARTFARTRAWYRRPVALVGSVPAVELLTQRIARHPDWGISVDLILSSCPESEEWRMTRSRRDPDDPVGQLPEGGLDPTGISGVLKENGIDRVVVAGFPGPLEARTELIHTLLDRGVAVDYVTGGPETLFTHSIAQHLEGLTVMSTCPSEPKPLDRAIKRGTDIVLSSVLLLLSAPVVAVAAIRIKRDSPGPVFFRQIRSGRNEEPFEIVKLRTMYEGAHAQRDEMRRQTVSEGNDDVLFKLDHDPRITPVGRWLRHTSIDEIPQLWNVLKGDMSMAGPRPLVPEEAEKAHGMYLARFRVKPGIAGPWQAEGRSRIPFEDMLRLDYSYVVGWSTAEDVRLFLRTLSAVLGRKGAR